MRGLMIFALLASACAAQSVSRASGALDLNGRPIPIGDAVVVQGPGGSTTRLETTQSVNGRDVPAEKAEERVISDDGTTRIVERTIRRFDPNGNPGPPEKVRIEEKKTGEGSSVTTVQVYRGDVNGNLALAERSSTVTQKSGNSISATTTVDRPTLNGSLDTVERRDVSATLNGDQTQETIVTSRRDTNGGFSPVTREVVDRTATKTSVNETKAVYESSGSGSLKLSNQYVTRTEKQPNGSEYSVVDVYSTSIPGRTQSDSPQPQLLEQEVIQKTIGSGGSVTEASSARRPDPSNPGKMGPLQPIATRVCSGNCVPKK